MWPENLTRSCSETSGERKDSFRCAPLRRSVEECQGALDLAAEFPCSVRRYHSSLYQPEKFSEAIEATFRYADPYNNDTSLQRAYIYTVAGEKDRAEEIMRKITSSPESYAAYDMATICAAAHNQDEALRWLETAFDRRSLSVVWIRVDPRLDNIRSHPRFRELLRGWCRVGRPQIGIKNQKSLR